MNIFETATRRKLRFRSAVGALSTEQLWDLPLLVKNPGSAACLNSVAKDVSRDLKEVTEESFVEVRPNPAKAELELKLEIVKHVIAARIEEQEKAKASAERAEKRRKLLDALSSKEEQELSSKSKEDILKELAALDA